MLLRMNMVVIFIALTSLCWQVKLTNSRTSTHWKLDMKTGKIVSGLQTNGKKQQTLPSYQHIIDNPLLLSTLPFDAIAELYANDEIFYIIATTIFENGDSSGLWIRQSPESISETTTTTTTLNDNLTRTASTSYSDMLKSDEINKSNIIMTDNKKTQTFNNADAIPLEDETLDCGKPVNFTYYDYLIGVAQRLNHPHVPDPEVAYLFLKTKDENAYKNFDLTALERRLKRAKRDKPRSVNLYNQIGNYWRIVGDARQSIECFRRALAMSPTNAEVLLNLARVLYNLQYLDDAIHLTRRSLEMQPPGRSAWQQYFTLGEIFKTYGHFQESILHLRHALELYPHHEPILKALRDIENNPTTTVHAYTVVIIVTLVFAVFIVIITSTAKSSNNCSNSSNGSSTHHGDHETRTQRHFSRAMAMRSLKGSVAYSRAFRRRKN